MTGSPGASAQAPTVLGKDIADRLAAAKLWLVSTQSPTTCGNLPYLATALYSMIPITNPSVGEMTVDAYWRLYVNPEWVMATNVPVVAARMAHLVWHLLVDHAGRAADLEVSKLTAADWQKAADATVADLLDDDALQTGLQGPRALKLPPSRSAEEYFAILSALPVTGPSSDEGGRGRDESPREHPPDASCGSGCDGQAREYEVPPVEGFGRIDEQDASDIRRRVAIEFREHQTSIGKDPGEWSRWVGQILDPVVPWTQVLAAAVRRGVGWAHGHTDYTYTRISRRQAAAGPVILPATRRPVPEIAIVVDTSGSIDDGLLAQALGEVDGVLTGLGVTDRSVTVLATDAAVHAVTRVRSGRDARVGGGGGTDMGVGIAAALELKPRPTLIVVLTDGYTPWPSSPPPTPVITVLIGRSRAELPVSPYWAQRVECVPE